MSYSRFFYFRMILVINASMIHIFVPYTKNGPYAEDIS